MSLKPTTRAMIRGRNPHKTAGNLFKGGTTSNKWARKDRATRIKGLRKTAGGKRLMRNAAVNAGLPGKGS